jgi:isopenicillin-N epimerase
MAVAGEYLAIMALAGRQRHDRHEKRRQRHDHELGTQLTRTLSETSWLVDPAIAYLNHGGYGALPVPVAEAAALLRAEVEANPTDLLARQWQERLDEVRRQVAGLLGARSDELVFLPNATTGMATVLASYPFEPGDVVVTTDHRYPAVANQTRALLDRRAVTNVEVALPLDVGSTDDVVATVMAAVTPRTRLLVVDHIASPTGFVFPVQALVKAAHDAGIAVLVDAAHAPGQVEVDLAAIDADFWVGNLHKWVCSPRAAAVMRVAPQWQQVIAPLVPSHHFGEGYRPAFDWTGTLDPVPLLAVPAALEFWSALGWDSVRARQHELVTNGANHVAERLGTRVPIADEMTAAMRLVELPVVLDRPASEQLTARLTTRHGVTAPVTSHQRRSYVRVCGQLYNRPAHYAVLAGALASELSTG